MATLLLRLAGPLQAWGTDSRFEIRRTENIPTKSGVIGMLAAALGRNRDADVSDLAELEFGVRVDQPGTVIEDFHVAINEKHPEKSYTTRRYYLSDAKFVVGVSSEDQELLEALEQALKTPVYPLFLGRRSCVPDPNLVIGIVDKPLKQALIECGFQGKKYGKPMQKPESLPIFTETDPSGLAHLLKDQPVSFDIRNRQHVLRTMYESQAHYAVDEHDAFEGVDNE